MNEWESKMSLAIHSMNHIYNNQTVSETIQNESQDADLALAIAIHIIYTRNRE